MTAFSFQRDATTGSEYLLLTAPDRNAAALLFGYDGAHRHGDRDGVKEG